MLGRKPCPVCERMVSKIEKWRNIYICVPCIDKFEKIEGLLKDGQYLDQIKLDEVLREFGENELQKIKDSESVHIRKKRGRKRRVQKNNEVLGIKPAARRKKRV